MLAPIKEMADRDAIAQVADFLLPTEGIDTVITYGIRRSKVILSARTTNQDLHIGRELSQLFPAGRAGGHKALAGGQIPFEDLKCINSEEALTKMTQILRSHFGGEENE